MEGFEAPSVVDGLSSLSLVWDRGVNPFPVPVTAHWPLALRGRTDYRLPSTDGPYDPRTPVKSAQAWPWGMGFISRSQRVKVSLGQSRRSARALALTVRVI